ncbi:MAG: hypothetical protein CMJ18_23665 [Phycisphaeraceae bacterium]|nr:hypothetical protein [Phycisphaeraceae bacterium]
MFSFFPLILVAFVVLVIVMIVAGFAQARRRREALAAWAVSRGGRFSEHHEHDLEHRHPEFDCLRCGGNRYAYNLVRGDSHGRRFCAFDYHYETRSRDSKGRSKTSHHHFSAVILEAGIALKPLSIRPEGIFDKISGFFGFDDIDFESAEFSRRFHVKAPDRRWAYDVLQPITIEYLLAAPPHSLEFDHAAVIAWTGRCFSVAQFESAITVIEQVLERLPSYLEAPS